MKPLLVFLRLSLLLALAWVSSSLLPAQDSAAETLQQKAGLPTQEITPPKTVLGTDDEDLGEIKVVQRTPPPKTFTLTTAQELFYTDNVFFTNTNPLGSTAYLGDYTASYIPYSLKEWTPRISAQYNMVRYATVPSGDFDNETLALSSQWAFAQDWTWTASANLARFTSPHNNDHEFYEEVVYDNQISHVLKLSPTLFFIGSYDLAYHQANPSSFDRLDNGLSFCLVYYPIPAVTISPFVRAASRNYFTNTATQNDRADANLSEGVDVTWKACDYLSLSADFSRTSDYSSTPGQSYNESSPGITATGTYKF